MAPASDARQHGKTVLPSLSFAESAALSPAVPFRPQWGTVCGFTAWFDQGSAAATCTQLGFPGPARIVNGTEYSSDTSLPIIIAHVACAANQTSLNACAFDRNTPENPTCEHGDDVGLVCTGRRTGVQCGTWHGACCGLVHVQPAQRC